MSETGTALVQLSYRERSMPTTAFGVFHTIVMQRFGTEMALAPGMRLIVLPIEQVLAQSLATLAAKLGARLGMRTVTENGWLQAVEVTNQMVTLGMLFQYGSPRIAADVFIAKVLRPKHFPLQPSGIRSLCNKEALEYFAACVSAVARVRGELEVLRKHIRRLDPRMIREVGEHLDTLNSVISNLTAGAIPKRQSIESLAGFATTLASRSRELLHRAGVIAHLPVVLSDDAAEDSSESLVGDGEFPYVDPPWIRTQICLAAVDGPIQSERLPIDQFQQAAMLCAESPDEVTKRFFERMTQMGMPALSEPVHAELLAVVQGEVRTVGLYRDGKLDIAIGVMVDLRGSTGIHLSHEDALDFLTRETGGGMAHAAVLVPDQILAAVDWNRVTAADIRNMASMQHREIELIVAGIAQMPRDDQSAAMAALMREVPPEEYEEFLGTYDVLPKTLDAALGLDPKVIGPFMEQQVYRMLDWLEQDFLLREHRDHIWKIFLHLPRAEFVSRLVLNTMLRSRFLHRVAYPLMMEGESHPDLVRMLMHFVDLEAEQRVFDFVRLGYFVYLCAPRELGGGGGYDLDDDAHMSFPHYPPWEERFVRIDAPDVPMHRVAMGLPQRKTRAERASRGDFNEDLQIGPLFLKYTEEEVYHWVFAGHPRCDELWPLYEKRRKAFYRAREAWTSKKKKT